MTNIPPSAFSPPASPDLPSPGVPGKVSSTSLDITQTSDAIEDKKAKATARLKRAVAYNDISDFAQSIAEARLAQVPEKEIAMYEELILESVSRTGVPKKETGDEYPLDFQKYGLYGLYGGRRGVFEDQLLLGRSGVDVARSVLEDQALMLTRKVKDLSAKDEEERLQRLKLESTMKAMQTHSTVVMQEAVAKSYTLEEENRRLNQKVAQLSQQLEEGHVRFHKSVHEVQLTQQSEVAKAQEAMAKARTLEEENRRLNQKVALLSQQLEEGHVRFQRSLHEQQSEVKKAQAQLINKEEELQTSIRANSELTLQSKALQGQMIARFELLEKDKEVSQSRLSSAEEHAKQSLSKFATVESDNIVLKQKVSDLEQQAKSSQAEASALQEAVEKSKVEVSRALQMRAAQIASLEQEMHDVAVKYEAAQNAAEALKLQKESWTSEMATKDKMLEAKENHLQEIMSKLASSEEENRSVTLKYDVASRSVETLELRVQEFVQKENMLLAKIQEMTTKLTVSEEEKRATLQKYEEAQLRRESLEAWTKALAQKEETWLAQTSQMTSKLTASEEERQTVAMKCEEFKAKAEALQLQADTLKQMVSQKEDALTEKENQLKGAMAKVALAENSLEVEKQSSRNLQNKADALLMEALGKVSALQQEKQLLERTSTVTKNQMSAHLEALSREKQSWLDANLQKERSLTEARHRATSAERDLQNRSAQMAIKEDQMAAVQEEAARKIRDLEREKQLMTATSASLLNESMARVGVLEGKNRELLGENTESSKALQALGYQNKALSASQTAQQRLLSETVAKMVQVEHTNQQLLGEKAQSAVQIQVLGQEREALTQAQSVQQKVMADTMSKMMQVDAENRSLTMNRAAIQQSMSALHKDLLRSLEELEARRQMLTSIELEKTKALKDAVGVLGKMEKETSSWPVNIWAAHTLDLEEYMLKFKAQMAANMASIETGKKFDEVKASSKTVA